MTTEHSRIHPEKEPANEGAKLLRQQIRSTRIFLFIVTAITLISAIVLTPTLPARPTVINLAVTVATAIIYLFLAIWARKRPYSAICYGLLLLAIVITADIFIGPAGPFNRWQSKLLTLVFLFLGLGDSRDAQRKMAKPDGH